MKTRSETPRTKTVTIRACVEHWGRQKRSVVLKWIFPECGGPRGKKIYHDAQSYDGGFWMYVDGWSNPCGHIDTYNDVRAEADAAEKESTRENANA
jgi:hypothetical protein